MKINICHSIQIDVEELAEFLVAGNFLNIPSLVRIVIFACPMTNLQYIQYLFGCQSMAKLIKDKTPEEIRELFGLEVFLF